MSLLVSSHQLDLAIDLCLEIIERCPSAAWVWKLLAPLQLEASSLHSASQGDHAPPSLTPAPPVIDRQRQAGLRQDAVRCFGSRSEGLNTMIAPVLRVFCIVKGLAGVYVSRMLPTEHPPHFHTLR